MSHQETIQPKDTKAPLSPLTEKKVTKDKLIKIGLVIIATFMVIAIMKSGKNDEKKGDKPAEQTANANLSAAPKLPLNAKEVQQLAQNVAQIEHATPDEAGISEAQKLQQMREAANTLVYQDDAGAPHGSAIKQNHSGTFANANDSNSQFLAAASDDTAPTVKARQLQHLNTLLAQGNMIAATLESRIASDLPGMVRAVTANDVYSEDNSKVLLPKGSRLIGQYNSGIAQGQNRVFVIWQRLIRPDGIDIQLNSPGTDALGTAGLAADSIDHHFFQQFGTAALLSVIGAGAANVGVNNRDNLNSATAYRSAVANSFAQSAQTTLQNNGVIKPTLYINQGQVITVFVAKDLDFYTVLKGQTP